MGRTETDRDFGSMTSRFKAFCLFIAKILVLVRPYGLGRLALVTVLIGAQAVLQVLGVTSIFPFLALAADPEQIRRSSFGREILSWLPPMSNQDLLVVAGCAAILLLVLSNAMTMISEFVRTRYVNSFGHWLRLRLVEQIVAKPYGYFLDASSGVLIKKVLGDVGTFVSGVYLPLIDAFARGVLALALTALLVLVHPVIALGTGLVLGLFYLIFFFALSRRRRIASESLKWASRGLGQELHQLFTGIKPIRLHLAEGVAMARIREFSERQSSVMAWLPVMSNAPRYLIEPIAFGGLVLVVVLYASQGGDFENLLPSLGVMALAGYRLIPSIQLFYGQASVVLTSRHALEEVYDEFQADRSKVHSAIGAKWSRNEVERLDMRHELRLVDVSFSYPSRNAVVLDRISMCLARNRSVAVVGQTGSGKSTLVDLIMGLHKPSAGKVLVDGRELTDEMLPSWRKGIGYVPQDIFLLHDTLAQNIALGYRSEEIDHDRLRTVCDTAQILQFIEEETEAGFESIVGERGIRLSGGQKQRIGLARALYHDPSLLVLDEATSALDTDTERALVQALNALKGKLSMIVIAHRLSTIENCDFRVTLAAGRLTAEEAGGT